jgi:hypothetical protein
MNSAFCDTDFEYSKTFDVRESFMDNSDEDVSPKRPKHQDERLGNDLDLVDIGPEFQV